MAVGQETYYEVLGVRQNATQEEIKAAYRRRIQEWHPDVCKRPNALEKSQQINEAYHVLKDPVSRKAYDEELRPSHESRYTQESATEHFRQETSYGRAAASRAEEMREWDIDQTLREAAVALWKGSKSYRREEAGCGSSMAVGCSAWFLVLALIFPPGAIILYFIIRGTFFPNGRFVGLGPILGGMAAWLGIAVVVGGIGISALNSMAENSSNNRTAYNRDYSSPTYELGPVGPEVPERMPLEEANAGLLKAAQDGDEHEVRRFIQEGADLAARGESEMTALHFAVAGESSACVAALIELGADLEAKDIDGFTPLHIAVQQVSVSMTEQLLGLGADVNARDNNDVTPLIIASRVFTYKDIADMEAESGRRLNRNAFAARNDARTGQMSALLEAGADINAANNKGVTALIICCLKGFELGANLLLDHGADPLPRTTDGESALDIATRLNLSHELLQRLQPAPEEVVPDEDRSKTGDGSGQTPPTVVGGGGGD
jgi:hypothetical protein